MPETVWLVSTYGRTLDRVCDTAETGKSVCDDLLRELSSTFTVVEDWANLNLPEAPPRWVRYIREGGSEKVTEQAVECRVVDTTGRWFRCP